MSDICNLQAHRTGYIQLPKVPQPTDAALLINRMT